MTTLESVDAEFVAMETGAISQLGQLGESPPKTVSGLGLLLEMAVFEELDVAEIEELCFAVKLRL